MLSVQNLLFPYFDKRRTNIYCHQRLIILPAVASTLWFLRTKVTLLYMFTYWHQLFIRGIEIIYLQNQNMLIIKAYSNAPIP